MFWIVVIRFLILDLRTFFLGHEMTHGQKKIVFMLVDNENE